MTPFVDEDTLLGVMRAHAQQRPGQEAVSLVLNVDSDLRKILSYGQLDAAARSVAGWLQARFEPGERVLLLFPVGVDFVIAFLGCVYAGMIAVPAPLPGPQRHERHRVRVIATDACVCAILTDADNNQASVFDWAAEINLAECPCMVVGDLVAAAEPWVRPQVDAATLMLLQYTSGSSGDPKGVMLTHNNILHNVRSFREALGFDEHTRFGGWIPLFHDMGLMAQLLPALLMGSTCVLMTPGMFVARPLAWLRMIDRYDLHFSAAPNFAFELCCRRVTDEQMARLDLSRWKFAVNGSEPIQAPTLFEFAKRFASTGFRRETLRPCYGMAEATVFVSGCGNRPPLIREVDAEALAARRLEPPRDGAPTRELVSCGVPVGFDVRIIDPDTGANAPVGRLGEIWLRGNSVSQGYWRNLASTSAAFGAITSSCESGFLRTGDLGLLLDGEIFVCGRLKEMLIVRGRNLYPQDVEFELRAQHPELATRVGAVFGIQDTAEEAVVVTHEVRGQPDELELAALAQDIRATVFREFGARAAGVSLLRSGSVLRTTSGKIQRNAMRDLFVAGKLPCLYESLDPTLLLLRQASAPSAECA
jgi:acyl-CoA synthetase (AMP-forming)/AMP-acid ligase II